MRWLIVGWLLLGCAASPAWAQAISFDDAKKGDEAKKLAFLDQELGKLVFDKEKNPKGCVKAWYYMANANQKAKAEAAMREDYKKDGREKSCEKEVTALLKSLESPSSRILPFYREEAPIARRKHQGILLVGDVLGLQDESEFRSTLDDYILSYLKSREEGMVFKDGDNEYELNVYAPATTEIAHTSLINLHARSVQIQKIAGKSRNASDNFRRAVVRDYLDSHKLYHHQLRRQQKIFDDNNQNDMQKEIVDFLTFARDMIHKNMKKAGVEHKMVDKDAFEYSLEGI